MRYAKSWQVIAMTIIWAVALIAFKRVTDQPTEQPRMVFEKPQIRMYVQHVGCEPQRQAALEQALKSLPWLGEINIKPRVQLETESGTIQQMESRDACTLRVQGMVANIAQVDFVQLVQALEKENINPAAIEFGGLPRYALQVEVFDLACKSCLSAAQDALTPLAVSASYYFTTATPAMDMHTAKLSTFHWLEKKDISVEKKTLTAYVKANDIARVDELIRAMNRSGLVMLALRVTQGQA